MVRKWTKFPLTWNPRCLLVAIPSDKEDSRDTNSHEWPYFGIAQPCRNILSQGELNFGMWATSGFLELCFRSEGKIHASTVSEASSQFPRQLWIWELNSGELPKQKRVELGETRLSIVSEAKGNSFQNWIECVVLYRHHFFKNEGYPWDI